MSHPTDPRILALRAAVEQMQRGLLDAPVPTGDDDLGALGLAVADLARTFETRLRQMRLLNEVTERCNSGVVLEEVLDHVFDSFDALIPYDRIGIALLEDNGRVLRARWSRSRAKEVQVYRGFAARMANSSLCAILETGQPRILNDLVGYLRDHPRSESTRRIVSEGMRSSLTCPLVAMGKNIGFIFFSSMRADTYADVHVDVFKKIAGQVSAIVAKSKLYEETVELSSKLERHNRFIRETFGRYITDEVVEELLGSEEGQRLGGERRRVTILMSDLRGFSSICEQLEPEEVVALLNHYLAEMVDVVSEHGGTIDEIIGDALLVIFGAPVRHCDHADRALRCAVQMQRAMASRVNVSDDRRQPPLEMGIAVHSGDVVVGNIGSHKRKKYSVVGREVNLTARLESFTVGGQVLVTHETLAEAHIPLDLGESVELSVKGLGSSLKAISLLGIQGGPRIPSVDDPLVVPTGDAAVSIRFLDGKIVGSTDLEGRLVKVGQYGCQVRLDRPLRALSDVAVGLVHQETRTPCNSYAKVVPNDDSALGVSTLRFSYLSAEVRAVLQRLMGPTRG